MDIAKEVLAASDSLDWAFVASKRDVSIFSRHVADESVQQVKAVTVINAGMENILSHLTNPNRRRGKKDAGKWGRGKQKTTHSTQHAAQHTILTNPHPPPRPPLHPSSL